MIASENQIKIYDTWKEEDCNMVINAVAGSGKTTTLLQLLEYCEHRTLFLAFNKSIQEEIQSKIEQKGLMQGKAMTLHSLGLQAVRNYYNKVIINNSKNFNIIKEIQKENKKFFKYMKWEDKIKLTFTLLDMNDVSRLFLTNDKKEILSHFKAMGKSTHIVPKLEELWQYFLSLREAIYEVKTGVEIDFIDMIYLPVKYDMEIPIKPYYLMVDEAQDLNLCQHKLVDNLIFQGDIKKWIAVGDKNQSIYAFSGAYSNSFDLFTQRENTKEMTLDICYRCPKSVIDTVNEVYDVMKYHSKEEGIVDTIDDIELIKDNSMIVCRNSSPLISLYFQLIGLNKSCYIKGDDILKSIMKFLKPYTYYSVGDAKLEMFRKLAELNNNKTDEGRLAIFNFKENFDNFLSLSKQLCSGAGTVQSLTERVSSLFVNKENAIILCTIHKAKGLESDIVYILEENLIPSKFAVNQEQLKQEENLRYVARSRAKRELYFLNLDKK